MELTRRTLLGLAALALLLPPTARAQGGPPPELATRWPRATLRGRSRARFLGLSIYDIRLWTPADAPRAADTLAERWPETPLALEIQYARELVGRLIAERSLKEMRRQGEIADAKAEAWQAAMARIFPDVQDGDRLTGELLPGQAARFYFNGQPRGEVPDAEFARMFFGIWLSPQTSEPDMRERLLGRAGR